MVDVRHKSLAEVRQTIRQEIGREQQYLKSLQQRGSSLTRMEEGKTQGTINAFQQTLAWLSDLEQ